jgi:cephamycin C biosynthesis protein
VLKARTGADEVVIFDATSRYQDAEFPPTGPNQLAHLRVHVDQNPSSAQARVTLHTGAATNWTLRRVQIVNLWRPLLAPVRNYPLALCDYRTVDPMADLVTTRLLFPPWLKDRENYSVTYSPRHRWYYWSALTPDEVLVFKCYDSASRTLACANGEPDRPDLRDVAGLCPHTAVVDPAGPTDGRLRTSLELRALALYR